MSQWPVHPTPVSVVSADSRSVYVIAESHVLPLVNVARSIRSEWLHRGAEKTYVRFTQRWKTVILGGYAVGFAAFWIVLFTPARVGRWTALAASVPTTFTSVVYFSLLRYEIVCLTVRTYEFWFFSVGNLVSAVLLAMYLNDLRATVALPIWFALQNNIFVDANTVFSRVFVLTSMGMLFFVSVLMVAISFGLIDNANEFELLWIDADRRLVVQDALLHGFSTQAIVLARNIYRRWTTPTRPRTASQKGSTITCVTLRARVKLQLADEGAVRIMPHAAPSLPQANDSILVRLSLVPVEKRFCAGVLLIPAAGRVLFPISATRRTAVRTLLLTFAYVGLSLTIVTAVLPNATRDHYQIRVLAFACSAVFIACLFTATQRQLLRRLMLTFDFVFLSFQLVVVHVCLCDMLGWGFTSLPVVTIWLWIQWVLTSDAVTPVLKIKWRIRRRLPAIIMLVFIVSQILVFVAILVKDTVELHNRVLLSVTVHGRLLEIRVIPTLLSRLVILFGWSWKVLWRMWTMRQDELLMIQGTMTYVNMRRPRNPQAASIPRETSRD